MKYKHKMRRGCVEITNILLNCISNYEESYIDHFVVEFERDDVGIGNPVELYSDHVTFGKRNNEHQTWINCELLSIWDGEKDIDYDFYVSYHRPGYCKITEVVLSEDAPDDYELEIICALERRELFDRNTRRGCGSVSFHGIGRNIKPDQEEYVSGK